MDRKEKEKETMNNELFYMVVRGEVAPHKPVLGPCINFFSIQMKTHISSESQRI